MVRLRIGEVAKRAGIETSTIRYYEAIGLLPQPERVARQRSYTEDVFHRLALIQAAKESGFTLREIRHMLHGFSDDTPASERWKTLAFDKIDFVEQEIAQLQRYRHRLERLLACQCRDLDSCAANLGNAW